MLYDKTALNFTIVNGFQIVVWVVSTVVFIGAEWNDHQTVKSISSEFYVADIFGISILAIFGFVYYLLYRESMKPKISDILLANWIISGWVIILAVILILIYQRKRRHDSQKTTDPSGINITRLDTGKSKTKVNEQLIRSLPTIIYQDYHDFNTKEWPIWDQEFSSGESLKVYPYWYHIFHSDWIKQWYAQRECWPVEENSIDKEELGEMKATFEADLIKILSK